MSRAYLIHYPVGKNGRMTVRFEQSQKSSRCPTGVRFAVIGFLTTKDGEREVIRIDNAPHHGIGTTHIHYLDEKEGKENVIVHHFKSYSQACDYVERYLRERDHD
jgi:hypothetical protein